MLKTRADGYPNLTIRLDALILYLGDPLLRFDSILDNNVPELDSIFSIFDNIVPELDKTVTISKKGGQYLCGVVYMLVARWFGSLLR